MAQMLVETLAGDFDPRRVRGRLPSAVEAVVKAKIEGGEVARTPEAEKSSGEVVDLLAALQRSVDAARTARGESPSDSSDDEDAKKTTKKSSAKKTTKKTAAKKQAKKAS